MEVYRFIQDNFNWDNAPRKSRLNSKKSPIAIRIYKMLSQKIFFGFKFFAIFLQLSTPNLDQVCANMCRGVFFRNIFSEIFVYLFLSHTFTIASRVVPEKKRICLNFFQLIQVGMKSVSTNGQVAIYAERSFFSSSSCRNFVCD